MKSKTTVLRVVLTQNGSVLSALNKYQHFAGGLVSMDTSICSESDPGLEPCSWVSPQRDAGSTAQH